jgi:hypothetical protein
MQTTEPNSHRHTLLSSLFAMTVAVAIAVCGSSSAKPRASSGPWAGELPAAMSRCMRASGVSNFPDPTFPAAGGIRIGIGR